MNKKEAIVGEALDILGKSRWEIPAFPGEYQAGFQCVFIPGEKSLEIDPREVTVSCIGKIWSNHGVFPLIRNPNRSIFDEFPFKWFMGFSNTSHFDYIYYLDAQGPDIQIYFRGEYGFYGEDRRNEIAHAFTAAISEFEKCRENKIKAEVIFHVREYIIREMTGRGFVNSPMTY